MQGNLAPISLQSGCKLLEVIPTADVFESLKCALPFPMLAGYLDFVQLFEQSACHDFALLTNIDQRLVILTE